MWNEWLNKHNFNDWNHQYWFNGEWKVNSVTMERDEISRIVRNQISDQKLIQVAVRFRFVWKVGPELFISRDLSRERNNKFLRTLQNSNVNLQKEDVKILSK